MMWQLQLESCLEVSVSGGGLMGAALQRPGDHVGRVDAALGETHGHAPDLLNGPADQRWPSFAFVFLGAELAGCSRDGGPRPSWQRRASPARRGDASRARN